MAEMTPLDMLSRPLEQLGGTGFYGALLDACTELLPVDSAQVMYFTKNAAPCYLDTFRTPDEIQSLYQTRYYQKCPMQHHWNARRQGGVVSIRSARQPDCDYREYFDVFYRAAGLRDEIGVFLPVGAWHALGLFLERDGRFRGAEVEQINSLFPYLVRLHHAHKKAKIRTVASSHGLDPEADSFAVADPRGRIVYQSDSWKENSGGVRYEPNHSSQNNRLDGSKNSFQPLGPAFDLAPEGYLCTARSADGNETGTPLLNLVPCGLLQSLSAREKDSLQCILEGYSVARSAEALGLSVNTVKTHRKRLFLKLDITSEREIFPLLRCGSVN